jgi:autotransporter-associated beta strand protein
VANGLAAIDLQIAVPLVNGGLTKAGPGTMQLTATSTYTGPTTVQGGTLALGPNASILSSAVVRIDSGATLDVTQSAGGYTAGLGQTLGGSGTVVGSVTFGRGSTLSPGMFSAASSAAVFDAGTGIGVPEAVPVPEPATLGLVGLAIGVVGLGSLRRQRQA